jgi:hypothetical protein
MTLLFTYLPMKMEQTECSETSAYKFQKPGNYPEENITTYRTRRKFEIKNTLHVSDGLCVHHQESKTVHTASYYTGSVTAC